MKSWHLAAAMAFTMGTVCLADGLYWVVGNRATNKCEIITSNPDTKLARSTISACPKNDPSSD
jgi:hypothetical protein